jgi:predicted flap endonuclease-1-like 5' DNA nuclease
MALPPLAAEPLDYPGPGPVDAMRDSEPVALSAEGMDDEGMDDDEALEAEREEEPYWDEEQEDFPPLESEGPPQDVSFGPFADVDLAPPPMPAPEPVRRQDLPAMRPLTLPGPRNGVPDNLQRIRGIGQKNEELLNSLGVYHFGQIAAWTPAEARWIASHLAFPERIERDDWIGQAIVLATGGDTGYVKAADRPKGGEEPPVAA